MYTNSSTSKITRDNRNPNPGIRESVRLFPRRHRFPSPTTCYTKESECEDETESEYNDDEESCHDGEAEVTETESEYQDETTDKK